MAGRPLSYTEEQAKEAIASSYSWAESLRKLGLCSSGGAWRVLKKYADLWHIPTDHFDPARCVEGNLRLPARPLDEVLVENSTYSRQHVKRRRHPGHPLRAKESSGENEKIMPPLRKLVCRRSPRAALLLSRLRDALGSLRASGKAKAIGKAGKTPAP